MDSFDSTLGRVDKDRGSRKTDQTNFRSRHPPSTLILQGLLELPIIIEKPTFGSCSSEKSVDNVGTKVNTESHTKGATYDKILINT